MRNSVLVSAQCNQNFDRQNNRLRLSLRPLVLFHFNLNKDNEIQFIFMSLDQGEVNLS